MQIIVVLDDHAGTQLGGRDRHLSKLSLYDGWLKPAEELALSKRSAPKGGRATSSAATGANALFYTDVRRLGKRWQKAKSSTTKVTKVHEGTKFKRVESLRRILDTRNSFDRTRIGATRLSKTTASLCAER
jgi:hypothetical protein